MNIFCTLSELLKYVKDRFVTFGTDDLSVSLSFPQWQYKYTTFFWRAKIGDQALRNVKKIRWIFNT